MLSQRRPRLAALAASLVFLLAGCYLEEAHLAQVNGTPVPWFCNPTAPNSVTGPGMGSVNWYAGKPRAPHDYATCKTVGTRFDLAKAYAEELPTLADAEAVGLRSTFAFIPGMGTHHGRGAITPELLVDPTFDRLNPIIPGGIDDVFKPSEPEFLQYNGNGADDVLVGMSYYVRTSTGLPPEGFPGLNDRWHHHPTLCLRPSTAQAFAVNTTDTGCADRGGINVHMDDYYMLHVWLVDDLEYVGDVHAPMHPCIKATGAIFNMSDPCHQPPAATDASTADGAPSLFCPIGTLSDEQGSASAA